jgi:quercetin dioxygenase-like cupin family protein
MPAVLISVTMTRRCFRILLLVAVALGVVPVSASSQNDQRRVLAQPLVKRLESLKWSPLFPELGRRASIATLRIDPRTHASQVVVRFLGPVHIPMHWHSSSESQVLLKGHLTVELNGVRSELDRGDFNYIPAKMPHETWVGKDGAIVYISSDGPWDFDWAGRPPEPSDLLKQPKDAKEEKDED